MASHVHLLRIVELGSTRAKVIPVIVSMHLYTTYYKILHHTQNLGSSQVHHD